VTRRHDELITDADFEVVRGPYRVGEEHRRHKGWYFIGAYDADGDPLFARKPAPYWRTVPGIAQLILFAAFAVIAITAAIATVASYLHPATAPAAAADAFRPAPPP
jgi:hypothetical protein